MVEKITGKYIANSDVFMIEFWRVTSPSFSVTWFLFIMPVTLIFESSALKINANQVLKIF